MSDEHGSSSTQAGATPAQARAKAPKLGTVVRGVWASLMLALGVLVLGAPLGWWADLCATFAWPLVLAPIITTCWWVIRRRWFLALATCCAAGLIGSVLLLPRAARESGAEAGSALLRLMIWNAHPTRTDEGAIATAIAAGGHDIMVFSECPRGLARTWMKSGAPKGPSGAALHSVLRRPMEDEAGWRVILSRWPLIDLSSSDARAGEASGEGGAAGGWVAARVERPDAEGGPFVVIAFQAQSPRTVRRWREGNALVREIVEAAREAMSDGLDVIVAGDLNGAPGGARSRALASGSGLLRCKPRWLADGTWPAVFPSWSRVAIDDGWIPSTWHVREWRTLDGGGSDHRVVQVTLAAPDAGE